MALNLIRGILPAWLLFIPTVLGSVASEPSTREIPGDTIVARYGDQAIREWELQARIRALEPPLRAPNAGESTVEWRRRILEEMVFEEMIARDATAATRGLEVVSRQIDQKVTAVLVREVMDRQCWRLPVTVSEDEILQDYQRRLEAGVFITPEILRHRTVFIDTHRQAGPDTKRQGRKRAEKALAEIRDGAGFSDVARRYSEAPVPVEELGGIQESRADRLNPAIRDVLRSLPPGEVSGIQETPYGFVILQSEGRIPSSTRPLEAVREIIETDLMSRRRQERFEAWLGKQAEKIILHMPYETVAAATAGAPVLSCPRLVRTAAEVLASAPELATPVLMDPREIQRIQVQDVRTMAQLNWVMERGIPEEEWFVRARDHIRNEVLARTILESRAVPTEQEILDVWQENPAVFRGKDTYRACQVWVPVIGPESPTAAQLYLAREKALEIARILVNRVREGEDLEVVAGGLGLRNQLRLCGESEYRTLLDLGYETQETIRGLQPGQVSDPFLSPRGYYVVTLLRDQREGLLHTLEDPETYEKAFSLARERNLKRLRERLRKEILEANGFRVVGG